MVNLFELKKIKLFCKCVELAKCISALFSRIEPKLLKKKLQRVYSKCIIISEADI